MKTLTAIAVVPVPEGAIAAEQIGEPSEDGGGDRGRARHLSRGRRCSRGAEGVDVDEEDAPVCYVAVGCRCALLRVVPCARRAAASRDRGVQAVRDHDTALRPEPVPLPQEGKSRGDAVGVREAVLLPVARGDFERLQLDPLARLDADESEPSSKVGLDPLGGRLNEAILERRRRPRKGRSMRSVPIVEQATR